MLRSDKVIAISKYITKYIETQYHFKSDSLTVIDRGVDISVFDHSNVKAERQESVMAALGLTHKQMEGKKILLVPARYSRIKGHLYLLKALAYLQYKDYLCIMIGKKEAGPNDYVHEIEKDIIAKKLSDKVVVCTTPTTDMPALYSLADIVVCPSTSPEGFGRTIIEAQAMHKVVIATNIGAPADIIAHGKTGFLAPVSDAATFSETLEAMLNMPTAEIQNIRDHAYQVVEEKYNLSVMCQRTIDTYCAALQECGL
jgi:glycosyltransferase involved in cell wall biosynthesis